MGVDRAQRHRSRRPPHIAEQIATRYGRAIASGKREQEVELHRGERDDRGVAANDSCRDIDLDVPEALDRRRPLEIGSDPGGAPRVGGESGWQVIDRRRAQEALEQLGLGALGAAAREVGGVADLLERGSKESIPAAGREHQEEDGVADIRRLLGASGERVARPLVASGSLRVAQRRAFLEKEKMRHRLAGSRVKERASCRLRAAGEPGFTGLKRSFVMRITGRGWERRGVVEQATHGIARPLDAAAVETRAAAGPYRLEAERGPTKQPERRPRPFSFQVP